MAPIPIFLLFLLSSLLSIHQISIAADTFTTTQFIKDGETIVSSGEIFEMGFFSPGESKNRYVGVWYKKISVRTVVWVANRETPITNSSGVLKIINPGVIALVLNDTNTIIWSSNTSRSALNPIAQLLDSGNLVVKDANDNNPENFYWQSFDYPCDTHLPGMKLGKNFVTGLDSYLSSWKSEDDPAPGDFTYRCDPSGYPQNILKKGSIEQYRSGPWNGLRFSGRPSLATNTIYTYKLYFNKEEVYYSYELRNNSVVSRFVLNQYGIVQRWTWVDQSQGWVIYLTAPTDNCDTYLQCGPYGSCNVGRSPVCGCLDKFVPKYPENWAGADWRHGCVRKTPLDCQNGDGFLKYSHVKLPDTRFSRFNESMTLEECKIVCLNNCSCMAYANLDLRNGGSGCLLWFGDLLDIKEFSEAGDDIYVRMASSELDSTVPQFGSKGKKGKILKVSLPLVAGLLLLSLCLTWYARKKKNLQLKRKGRLGYDFEQVYYTSQSHKEEVELPLFGLSTVANATNNFSMDNKLGEGGFGPVYLGMLEEGRKIAVKRLSKTSSQGFVEFKNEVISIAKLQHRNLVKLLGCCIQGEEKMLIYEYMPNKSLNSFLFDETRSKLLDWPKRLQIINGIARGLLYLHQDSRLRVIHRDLKASNILLDSEMNPKISDFGLARSFGGDETRGLKTKRVIGTYGYMSPEYAIDGIFSVKSDVFSFGVLVLEIVSGKKNRGFIHPDHSHNLPGHAWLLHKEGRSMELVDHAAVGDSCCPYEVVRSIEVGLLCVQQCPEDRPTMSTVILMLGSKGSLPQPKQPGFFTERTILEAQCSIHEISNTLFDGR
ncbi:hypothetical protein LguiB_002997 [Lonicera macranthoides]